MITFGKTNIKAMRELLLNYAKKTTGLSLYPLPTGTGKTYQVLQYIANNYQGKRKIIFLTNLKKNLPLQNLKKIFHNQGCLDDFDKNVLMIESNLQSVINNWNCVLKDIPEEIKSTDEFKNLKIYLDLNQKSPITIPYKILDGAERDFRKLIQDYLEKKYEFRKKQMSPDNRLYKLKNKEVWLINLYPAILTNEKNVLFLSADKFFQRNTTFIEPSYYFINATWIENSIVFIDEFDAVKQCWLADIINSGNNAGIDFLALFSQIFNTINQKEFPAHLMDDVKEKAETSLAKTLDVLRDKGRNIYNCHNLQLWSKTVGEENKENFLFFDNQHVTAFRGGNKYAYSHKNETKQINEISFLENRIKDDGYTDIRNLLLDIRQYLNFFVAILNRVIFNYKKKNDLDGKICFIENAENSILECFNLNREQRTFLSNQLHQYQMNHVKRDHHKMELDDLSFYMKGFNYYSFVNSENHAIYSKIYYYSYTQTPESFLLSLCQKANVIGISATAECKSVLANFDLRFMASRLGDKYSVPDDVSRKRLLKAYQDHTKYMNKVNLKVDFVDCLEDIEQDALALFGNEEIVNEIFIDISNKYRKRRLMKFFHSAYLFLKDHSLYSFLWLSSALPSEKGDFSVSKLQIGWEHLKKKLNISEASLEVIKSDAAFEQNKSEIISRLYKGEKILLVSAYQTIGAGQNLQYPIPEFLKDAVVKINNQEGHSMDKDFDGLYIEKPTNLLVNLNDEGRELCEDDMVKYIFQMEYLGNSFSISRNMMEHEVRRAFMKRMKVYEPKSTQYSSLYDVRDVRLYSIKTIEQAVGRISRCVYKNPNMLILVDKDLEEAVNTMNRSDLHTFEFTSILEGIPDRSNFNADIDEYTFKAIWANLRGYTYINRQRNALMSYSGKYNWKKLRECVLRYPVLSDLSLLPVEYHDLYIELPEDKLGIKYQVSEDYRKIEKVIFCSMEDSLISPSRCYLEELMKLFYVYNYFKDHNYASKWENGKYMISPILFNNIYKGALGEVAGKCMIENYFNIKLEELDESEFELFDYRYKRVYIDFKYWNDSYEMVDNQGYMEEIIKKKERVQAKTVLIININARKNLKIVNDEDIIKVPSLYDFNTFELNLNAIKILSKYLAYDEN